MKIEVTKEEIMSRPNNMELGEYVRRKLLKMIDKNLTNETNSGIFVTEDESSLKNGSGSSEGRASV